MILRLSMAFCAAAVLLAAETPCDRLSSLDLKDAKIVAELVPAGPFHLPAGPGGAQQPPMELPAHCRVAITAAPTPDSDIGIEIWLPAEGWNGKYEAVGGGGWAGIISYPAMGLALQEGYATSSTDTGHKGGNASFALGHPEKVVDFSWRAVHEMTVKSKAVIQAFYGRGPRLSYWNGCSTGGRQGLMEAQRFPEDFDGIVAGAPANYQTHLHAWSVAVGVAALKDPESNLPPAKLALLNKGVLAACDAGDGIKDGLLADPRKCHFDPAALLCKPGSSGDDCLTAAQVEAAKKIYAPLKSASGKLIFPTFEPGSELGWTILAGGPKPASVATDTFTYLVHKDPNWDWRTFDLDKDTAAADAQDNINATQANLSAFKAHGGKLLMYHGWNDQLIAPQNSINYYSSVLEAMGPKQDDWFRLFMAPGMQHCGGGPGPNQFPAMGALERWRESGEAPGQITAYHVANNRVDRTRPLCPYPQMAVWSGTGSTNDAVNFSCRKP